MTTDTIYQAKSLLLTLSANEDFFSKTFWYDSLGLLK